MTETKERAARPNKGERKMVPIRFPLDVLESLDSRALTDGLARNDAIVEAVKHWATGSVSLPSKLPGAPEAQPTRLPTTLRGNIIAPNKPSVPPPVVAKPSVAAQVGDTPDPGKPAYGSRLKGAPVKKARAKKPA